MKKQKQKLPSDFNSKASQILAKAGINEWGSDIKLSNLTTNTCKLTPITEGTNDSWAPNFTWNNTAGYTIGEMHRHQAAGPSPDDVFGLMANRYALSNIGATYADKQFYESSAYAAIVLNTATYIVNINDWGTVQAMYAQYADNKLAYENTFRAAVNDYQIANNVDELTATTAVLKNWFEDAISLYKAPVGTTNFAIAGFDANGKLILIPCP